MEVKPSARRGARSKHRKSHGYPIGTDRVSQPPAEMGFLIPVSGLMIR